MALLPQHTLYKSKSCSFAWGNELLKQAILEKRFFSENSLFFTPSFQVWSLVIWATRVFIQFLSTLYCKKWKHLHSFPPVLLGDKLFPFPHLTAMHFDCLWPWLGGTAPPPSYTSHLRSFFILYPDNLMSSHQTLVMFPGASVEKKMGESMNF